MTEQKDWYSNKELFEMMQRLEKQINELCLGLTRLMESKLLERLETCEKKLANSEGQKEGGQSLWGYIVGGTGLLFGILSIWKG